MEYRVGNSMSNWVCNSHRMGNGMSNWVGDNSWMSNSMSNWVSNNSWMSNSMSNWVSYNSSLNHSWSILRNSFISYILNNSVSIVSILDSLNPTIRKSYCITTRGGVTISVLGLLEVSTTVIIIDTILI